MKKQTFIVKYFDKEGKELDFFRHSQKQLNTVLNEHKRVIGSNEGTYKEFFADGVKIVVHKTDYETTEDNKVYEGSFAELLR